MAYAYLDVKVRDCFPRDPPRVFVERRFCEDRTFSV